MARVERRTSCSWHRTAAGSARDGEGAVLLGAAGRERRETDHEEVQARERDEVHRELAKVGVELTREAEAARDCRTWPRRRGG